MLALQKFKHVGTDDSCIIPPYQDTDNTVHCLD